MRAQIKVLSAGAVKTGIRALADAYSGQDRGEVAFTFATAPTIKARVLAGEVADVVAVPPGAMSEFVKAGKVDAASQVALGRVGAGVAVRAGTPLPDIATVEGLKRSLLRADTIAFNKASTGLYLEALFERLGLSAQLAAKSVRYDNGAGVMEHLLANRGRDIGFGAVTEIIVFKDKGVHPVGPLPEEIQNYTRYAAALMSAAPHADAAREFLAFVGSEEGRTLLSACGIEAA